MHSGTQTRLKGSDITDWTQKNATTAGRVVSCAASDAHSSVGKYSFSRWSSLSRRVAGGLLRRSASAPVSFISGGISSSMPADAA